MGRVFVSLLRVVMCAHGLAVRSKSRSISFERLPLLPCLAPFVGILVAPIFPISATSFFSFSFWGSGITLVYQLFEAFSRIGFYDCALELAGATGIVERRMAMSNAQSLGRWQGTFR